MSLPAAYIIIGCNFILDDLLKSIFYHSAFLIDVLQSRVIMTGEEGKDTITKRVAVTAGVWTIVKNVWSWPILRITHP